jgi:hypothetical protein
MAVQSPGGLIGICPSSLPACVLDVIVRLDESFHGNFDRRLPTVRDEAARACTEKGNNELESRST